MKGGDLAMEDFEKFRISLAAARVNANMTQADVAEKIGVSRQTIINWESNKVSMSIADFTMLSKIYNIPQEYIFLPNKSTKS